GRSRGAARGDAGPAEAWRELPHGSESGLGDGAPLPQHGERLGVQPRAEASRAGLVDLQPLDPRIEDVVLRPGLLAILVPVDAGELQPCSKALATPAVLGVEREQARVGLREAAAASRAGALGREHALGQRELDARGTRLLRSGFEAVEAREHGHYPLAVPESTRERPPPPRFILRRPGQG